MRSCPARNPGITKHTLLRFVPHPLLITLCVFAHACRLANPSYLTEKITSSLISSLATGVPLLVDEEFLRSYSMLDNSTAFVLQPDETLCAAYDRIRGMAAAQYWAQRSRLLALAARLNEEAAKWFGEVLQTAQDIEGVQY